MQSKNDFFTIDNYAELKDEELILKIKQDDEKALTCLLDKYKELVNIKDMFPPSKKFSTATE